ncbi:MAG: DNA-formamidopyrimidine glycosylase [Parcubacteria group bacterium]
MPELPEVQTTVDGLNKTVKGKHIVSVWTDYSSPFYKNKEDIKNPVFYKKFKKEVSGQKILKTERRAKNILIRLENGKTILVHMKMTGFFYYDPRPDAKFVRLRLTLSDGKILAFSDMRKFAKVTLINTPSTKSSPHLLHLGPEPLEPSFKLQSFNSQLKKRPNGKIKQVLMDQTLIAGIGNIYSDEILWRADVHPLSRVGKIPPHQMQSMFKAMKETLAKGIEFGGDSMSDYKNIHGEKGSFQDHHHAYQKYGEECDKKGCSGVLEKLRIGGRTAHFCPKHQKLFI